MRYLLSPQSRPILETLARSRTLCAFDFDGTLAPLVDHPDDAQLPSSTRSLLTNLAACYPCVILSGRARADVLKKLLGVGIERVFGSHGADQSATQPAAHPQVQQWKTDVELALRGSAGLWVEYKGLSLAIHYRQAEDKAEAERQILSAVQKLHHAHIFGGKDVVNVVVAGDPHKGHALSAERERLACDWVLYVGDDENDEDAFGIGGNLVGARIGKNTRTKARYYLRSQPEIDVLMERLLTLRMQAEPIDQSAEPPD